MGVFEEFERDLREALTHLYDPLYQPPESLWAVMGLDPEREVKSLQTGIIQAIEDLRPDPSVPPDATARRFHQLLLHRYVKGLTQQVAAERLGMTSRHLRGLQWKAVRALARLLWERGQVGTSLADDHTREEMTRLPDAAEPGVGRQDWASQVQQELASLQRSAPGAAADVGAAIRRATELMGSPTKERGIDLEAGHVRSGMLTKIHPSALRQILIVAIAALAEGMSSGTIVFGGERKGDRVQITVKGYPLAASDLGDVSLIRQVLDEQGGSVEVYSAKGGIALLLELPALPTDRTTVLVVEDNADLISFYRSYVAGTRYEIVHLAEGRRLFEAIAECKPAIVVLDVMLDDPDIDGWELLVRLHGNPATRSIPVVVCSVVLEEQLALTLGATVYLPKPVRCRQVIGAQDEALSQAPIGVSRAAGNNAAAC